MGMYTEFCFNAELMRDVPEDVLAVLKYMADPSGEEPPLPEHEFFSCERWEILFVCDSSYFPNATTSAVHWDVNAWFVSAHSSLKNYDDEISKFVDWILPYLSTRYGDAFLGYRRHEEDDHPTLIYADGRYVPVSELLPKES